jgi:AhpD family alkylhydroperoxidase
LRVKNGFETILDRIAKNGVEETADEWMEAIKEDSGRVPLIFQRMRQRPDVLISHLLYKNSVVKTSKLEAKYVELISLAVSAALKCNHCIEYHMQAALRMGATKDEVMEAILIAGLTAQSSVLADAYRTYDDKINECMVCGDEIVDIPDQEDGSCAQSCPECMMKNK